MSTTYLAACHAHRECVYLLTDAAAAVVVGISSHDRSGHRLAMDFIAEHMGCPAVIVDGCDYHLLNREMVDGEMPTQCGVCRHLTGRHADGCDNLNGEGE